MNRSNLSISTLTIYFTNYSLVFLFINYLTKHKNINNMRYMNLKILFDFIHVLLIKQKHSTRDDYFSKYILFTIIYLVQGQKLNHINYSK
jgi:hypothetical protein